LAQPIGLGATYQGNGRCRFLVWAPLCQKVDVHIVHPRERLFPLQRDTRGYYQTVIEDVKPGSLYFYRLDGRKERPDPTSRLQPQGVHGPSQVVDSNFMWEDGLWFGLPLQDYIIYELHVGTFSPEGTFEAIIPHLNELQELGITAIELMPVAQFPGARNWGYDGVYPFGVQDSYGGSVGLKRLVNACHQKGLAVVLDVVYNHLGPEGNYLGDFGYYFTDRYSTPWGRALNFDGPYCDEVRQFFIENALNWVTQFHIDALRLDAVHAILDHSPHLFVEELAISVQREAERLNRHIFVMFESHLNDSRLIRSRDLGGCSLDAIWNDDFHHSLHALLTGEQNGYYLDFGQLQHLVKALREGFVYSGEYAPFWKRRRGNSSKDIPSYRFVVFGQNHDQVGNRMLGERLSNLVSFESLKLAAGTTLLAPFIPLLFMGEEYGEKNPFLYFISHTDPALIEAVRRGRREDFSSFHWRGEPLDPQDESTFLHSKLNHELRKENPHRVLLDFYKELIRLRKGIPALACLNKEDLEVVGYEREKVLYFRRWTDNSEVFVACSFSSIAATMSLPIPAGSWSKLLDSAESRWLGQSTSLPNSLAWENATTLTLSPLSIALFSADQPSVKSAVCGEEKAL
jgi:maltooligosyltrehalose trehalohydrolase